MRAFAMVVFVAAMSVAALGCAKGIGDGCSQGVDCSQHGDRICDTTQPNGYCTTPDCEPGHCPSEAVCVAFRPTEPRLTRRFCMRRCSVDGDCRVAEGYQCVPSDATVAAVLDACPPEGCPGYCIERY